jgi:ferritin-like metal-binding protein YciE
MARRHREGSIVRLDSLQDVFADQLGDLRSAETQLIAALPKMRDAAYDAELKEAFADHLEETRGHLARLEDIVSVGELDVPDEECEGMKGLIREGEEIVQAGGPSLVKDVALIAAAQRVEHYEIAAYGTALALARQLDEADAGTLLDETLDEESAADKLLTKLATGGIFESGINEEAANRSS